MGEEVVLLLITLRHQFVITRQEEDTVGLIKNVMPQQVTKWKEFTACTPGSLIENYSYNYIHFGVDYQSQAASGCTPCGGAAQSDKSIRELLIKRYHRSRQMTSGDFGPGVYLNCNSSGSTIRSNDGGLTSLDPLDPGYVTIKITSEFLTLKLSGKE